MDRHDIGLEALRIEGGLLPAEFVQRLLAFEAPHQGASDYAVPHGLTLRDEIGRYWRIAAALWGDYKARRGRPGADVEQLTTRQWLEPLFQRVFGFEGLTPLAGEAHGDRHFPITHKLGATPLLLTNPGHGLDRADSRFAPEGRRRSPHALLQEYLNASQAALWGVVTNGEVLRILRDNPSLTRPAYIEADLARIFEEERYADFVALWLIVHGTRFGAVGDPARPILEHWHDLAQETGERALEHLRDGVTAALRALGNGFLAHPTNQNLRERLRTGALTPVAYYTQLLRLVYRLILLFTAEDRGLLHPPGADPEAVRCYREGYAAERLRQRALRRREDARHADLWQGLQVVLRGLAQGAAPLALPALGGLFRADRCPDLDGSALANDRLLEAVRSLCFFRSDKVLARINYRDMDTEELGSVYESLLELFPRLDVESNPWRFQFAGDEAEGGGGGLGTARKLSGSFYTPDLLVQELVRSALEPKIAEALRAIDPRAALLALRIIDPACGSGHFLLAAARRLAAELARLDSDGTVPEAELYRHALREVVAHCIYGVDLNPLAVELCQTALWLETLEPGKPLGFLDHHVRCGNSLVGILDPAILKDGIPDAAYKPLTGDDKAAASQLRRRNRDAARGMVGDLFSAPAIAELPPTAESLDALPEDTLADIEAKRDAWERAQSAYAQAPARLLADLFCAAFFAPKTTASWEQVPTNEDLMRVRAGQPPRPGVAELIRQLAETFNFFHWHLAFPEVLAADGFDVVLANPPWDRIKLEEQEFFGSRSPNIAAAPNAAARTRMIEALNVPGAGLADQQLYREFQVARRGAEAISLIAHDGRRFPLTGVGDVNVYALFVEAILQLIGNRGTAGIVVPTGIATDDSTKAFFEGISQQRRLISLYDFRTGPGLFPEIGHQRYKFCLLTLGSATSTDLVFFALAVDHLRDTRRHFQLTPDEIALLNPNTKTCPVFRSQADAELAKKIYRRVPVLVDEGKGPAGNPWGISFLRMLDMSNDSGLFRTAAQLKSAGAQRDGHDWYDPDGQIWVPLYEAKMIHQFDHRWATYEDNGTESRDLREDERASPEVTARPRYWVPQLEVQQRLRGRSSRPWLMGWRDITNATNERTAIAAVIPISGVGNNMPLWFVEGAHSPQYSVALLANICALTLDFSARHKIGGVHLNFFAVKQLPILAPDRYSDAELHFIVPRVLELTYTASDLMPFARDLGYEGSPFVWDPDRRALLRAELDAYYAKLYGLTRDELRYILDPADVYGEDYPSETFRVLKNNEMRQFGEYRTRRLVLEAWDRLVGRD
jgi:hypothetical protein